MNKTTAQDFLDYDPRLRMEVVSCTPFPQRTCWIAMHQDYSRRFALDNPLATTQTEAWYGERVVSHCINSGGHFGVIEHPQIVLNVGGFPHDVMQQLRTHRHLSFDVQSGRYTSEQFLDKELSVEDVYWFRPPGFYQDRATTPIYEYTKQDLFMDALELSQARSRYCDRIQNKGVAPEHGRQINAFGVRQNFVLSGNLRVMLHLLMLRGKKDVQLETQAFALLLQKELHKWAPEIADWWETKGTKLKLTP